MMTRLCEWLDFRWNSKWPYETLLEARIMFSLALILQAITLVVFLLFLWCGPGHAHDQKRADLDNWYKGLNSKGYGYCCIGSEANGLADSDWESKDGNYRVFIFGDWRDVPSNAVLTGPNLSGRTLVWASKAWHGGVVIRCFMPGPMS